MAAVPKATLAMSTNCFPLPPQRRENQGVPQAQHLLPIAGAEQPVHHTPQFLIPGLNQAEIWKSLSICFRKACAGLRMHNKEAESTWAVQPLGQLSPASGHGWLWVVSLGGTGLNTEEIPHLLWAGRTWLWLCTKCLARGAVGSLEDLAFCLCQKSPAAQSWTQTLYILKTAKISDFWVCYVF